MSEHPLITFWRSHGADTRAAVALANQGYDTLEKLASTTAAEFLRMPNIGKKAIITIEYILKHNGLVMRPNPRHATKPELWYAHELRRYGWTVIPPE